MNERVARLVWPSGSKEGWSHSRKQRFGSQIVFELPKLPNFAEPRFRDLGERLEDRKLEVARRQVQMLRQVHGLGSKFSISLRLRRDGFRLRLFVLAQLASDCPIQVSELDRSAGRIQNMVPKEYNPVRILPEEHRERWRLATDLSWVRFAGELLKPEKDHRANTWPYFYVVSLWQMQFANDMETLCRTLLRFNGEAMVDVTLIPATLHRDEINWLDDCVQRMREALTGERLYSRERGRLLKSYEPIPGLKAPLENYEDLVKRYSQKHLFMYAFRVFASEDPFSIVQALAASATRSQPEIISLSPSDEQVLFETQVEAGQQVDIAPEIHSPWWREFDTLPYRVQRLHRLADLDEVSSFFRLPIPVQVGFPGFELDVGNTGRQSSESRQPRVSQVDLGQFSDDTAKTQLSAAFDRGGLVKHGLIVGVPGSGKTTAMFSILHQLWTPPDDQARIPFIVLEPAKTEYRALKRMDAFRDEMLVFTMGDERTSPFRLNPFEVQTGIPLESHVSRLNACFTGAFNLFDPLPLLLDKAIRDTYEAKGWFHDSVGGEPGLVTPTLSDLCRQTRLVMKSAGYSARLRDDFNAALLQRLESLRRGSKGRMLDTRQSIPFAWLMEKPVILELDALNESEKSLLMMFILTFVYEYARATRRSGSPLRHVMLVEEAHSLIGRGGSSHSEFRANPKEEAIRLFVRMLAEMRALGEGILIADQLPTALAPEAVKQTNLKVLMRMTAMDDRLEIGNTMDLGEAELKAVTRFKSGQAYVYLEEWDRVRRIQMPDFKGQRNLEVPPDRQALALAMNSFEDENSRLFMPFPECSVGCQKCNRRVRSQAERFARPLTAPGSRHIAHQVRGDGPWSTICRVARLKAMAEADRLRQTYGSVDTIFPFCAYVHLLHAASDSFEYCRNKLDTCDCKRSGRHHWFRTMIETGEKLVGDALERTDDNEGEKSEREIGEIGV